jgi:hypothetical protein
VELLVMRYGTPDLVEVWSEEGLPLDRARDDAEVMVDQNVAAPVALVIDGELREVRFPPEYDFVWGTPENRAEAQRLLDQAKARS